MEGNDNTVAGAWLDWFAFSDLDNATSDGALWTGQHSSHLPLGGVGDQFMYRELDYQAQSVIGARSHNAAPVQGSRQYGSSGRTPSDAPAGQTFAANLPGFQLTPYFGGHSSAEMSLEQGRGVLPAATGWMSPVNLSELPVTPSSASDATQGVLQAGWTSPPATLSVRSDPLLIGATPAAVRATSNLRARNREVDTRRFICGINGCRKSFSRRYEYERHQDAVHALAERHYHCCMADCAYSTGRTDKMNEHCRHKHPQARTIDLIYVAGNGNACSVRGCSWETRRRQSLQWCI